MAISDTIGDFLTRIRNGVHAEHRFVDVKWSKMRQKLAEILKEQGFIENFLVKKEGSIGTIRIFLKYTAHRKPVIQGIKRISKPGLRRYTKSSDIRPVLGGMGISIVSTSQGLITGEEAKQRKVGGESSVTFGNVRRERPMSRKGKVPVTIPSGVEIKATKEKCSVKGSKGTLEQKLVDGITVEVKDNEVFVNFDETSKAKKSFHGLYRSLLENMIEGVTKGFTKELQMIGVGYRAAVQGKDLDIQVGLSHPCKLPIPEGIEVKVEKNTKISITGANKQAVGQFAADIRSKRPPEPYQGKGIRYVDEYVRRKAGKAAAK